ncbi:MAG: hypothetical protein GF365_01025 [Candidatus Buchananbacteria bacterium]|nr:hypothetical protein [Candidatus Buchananbacteria bacterium]
MAAINKEVLKERVENLQAKLPFKSDRGGKIIKIEISVDYQEVIFTFSDGSKEKLPANLFLLSTN